MKQMIEIMRHNVTPAQFLAYVRAQLKKKGLRDISSDLDLDYFVRGNDLNFDYHDEPGRPCKAEKSVSHPYEMQTYILNWDGSCYNEICEFEFDDEKTGWRYYYLCNTEPTNEEEEHETMNERRFELPCADSRKSFYGKAHVIEKNGEKLLESYNTIVCKIDNDGDFVRMWEGYSATTMRHVNSFLAFYGINKGGKAFWDSLPVEDCKPTHSDMTPLQSYNAMIARRYAG